MTEEQATYTATKIPLQEQIDALRSQFQRLQDANLGPVLESSAVLVELRRIADALERQNRITVNTCPPCDCDELWRLARQARAGWVGDVPWKPGVDALMAYVREHS